VRRELGLQIFTPTGSETLQGKNQISFEIFQPGKSEDVWEYYESKEQNCIKRWKR